MLRSAPSGLHPPAHDGKKGAHRGVPRRPRHSSTRRPRRRRLDTCEHQEAHHAVLTKIAHDSPRASSLPKSRTSSPRCTTPRLAAPPEGRGHEARQMANYWEISPTHAQTANAHQAHSAHTNTRPVRMRTHTGPSPAGLPCPAEPRGRVPLHRRPRPLPTNPHPTPGGLPKP